MQLSFVSIFVLLGLYVDAANKGTIKLAHLNVLTHNVSPLSKCQPLVMTPGIEN
jgi:hypothetical protein